MLAVLLAFPLSAAERGVNRTRLTAVVRSYSDEAEFEVVPVGGLLLGLLRSAVRMEAASGGDPDAMSALRLLDGLRKCVIVEYEGCDDKVRESFNRDIAKVLRKADKLMEVKDSDGEVIRLFGTQKGEDMIRDVVLFCPESSTLICLYGTLSAGQIAEFAAAR